MPEYPNGIEEAIEQSQDDITGRTVTLVDDLRTISLLESIYTVLKKIEYHLSIASDTHLNDQDV